MSSLVTVLPSHSKGSKKKATRFFLAKFFSSSSLKTPTEPISFVPSQEPRSLDNPDVHEVPSSSSTTSAPPAFWTPTQLARLEATKQANDEALDLLNGPATDERVAMLAKILVELQSSLASLDGSARLSQLSTPDSTVPAPVAPPKEIPASPVVLSATTQSPETCIDALPKASLPQSPNTRSIEAASSSSSDTPESDPTDLTTSSASSPQTKRVPSRRLTDAQSTTIATREPVKKPPSVESQYRMESAKANVAAIRALMAVKKQHQLKDLGGGEKVSQGQRSASVAVSKLAQRSSSISSAAGTSKAISSLAAARRSATRRALLCDNIHGDQQYPSSTSPTSSLGLPPSPPITPPHLKHPNAPLFPCPRLPLPPVPSAAEPKPELRLDRSRVVLKPLLCSVDPAKSIVFDSSVPIPKTIRPTSTYSRTTPRFSTSSSSEDGSQSYLARFSTLSRATSLNMAPSSNVSSREIRPLFLSTRSSISYTRSSPTHSFSSTIDSPSIRTDPSGVSPPSSACLPSLSPLTIPCRPRSSKKTSSSWSVIPRSDSDLSDLSAEDVEVLLKELLFPDRMLKEEEVEPIERLE